MTLPFSAKDQTGSPSSPQIIAVTKKDSENQPGIPEVLSILPVRGMVIFPGTVVPLSIRRPSSLKMLDEILPKTKIIGLLSQRKEEETSPKADDLYQIGVAGNVLKLMRQTDDVVLILVQALQRIRVRKFVQNEPYFRAEIEPLQSSDPQEDKQWTARVNNLKES